MGEIVKKAATGESTIKTYTEQMTALKDAINGIQDKVVTITVKTVYEDEKDNNSGGGDDKPDTPTDNTPDTSTPKTTNTSGGCKSSCSGGCVSGCSTDCGKNCVGACAFDCVGGCKEVCGSACTGACVSGCKQTCTGACSSCGGTCAGSCFSSSSIDNSKDRKAYLPGGAKYNTGGYTGSWGSEGKLAILHEKEIVLNKEDTENLLASVQMVRDYIHSIDLNTTSRLALNPYVASTVANSSSQLD
jgi:hypothetical protein